MRDSRGSAERATEVVGREREIGAIRAALADRGAVAVIGPTGIGKTTTVASALADEPHVIGVGVPALGSTPHFALEMALRRELVGNAARIATKVIDVLGETILWIEDLHWVDPPTVEVLEMVVGRVPLALTTRRADLPASHLALLALTSHVELEPLERALASRVVRSAHPRLTTDQCVEAVETAQGNPLLLTILPGADGAIAPTMRDALIDRVEREPPAVADALRRLAVLGRPAPDRVAREAEGSALVVRGDAGIWFRHPHLAEVLASIVARDPVALADVHADLAARVDSEDAGEHWLAAGRAEAALTHARSHSDGQTSAAVRARHLLVAVGAMDALGRRDDDLRLDAAGALVAAQRYDDAVELAETVVAGGTPQAEARFVVGRARWFQGDVDGALEAYADAIASAPQGELALRARVHSESAYLRLRHRLPGALAEAALAMEFATVSGAGVLRARSLLAVAHGYSLEPGWEATLRETLAEARAGDDREVEMVCAYSLTSGLGFTARMSEANPLHEEQIERAEAAGLTTWASHFESARLMNLALMGTRQSEVIDATTRLMRDRPRFRAAPQAVMAQALALTDVGAAATGLEIAQELVRSGSDAEDRLWGAVALGQCGWLTDNHDALGLALSAAHDAGDSYFGMRVMVDLDACHMALDRGEPPVVSEPPAILLPLLWPALDEIGGFELLRDGDSVTAAKRLMEAASGWERHEVPRLAARAEWAAARLLEATSAPGAARARRHAVALARTHELRGHLDHWGVPRSTVLSAREHEVLRLVAEGLTSRQIGDRLRLSSATVDSYIGSARHKLGASSRREAALIATRDDIPASPPWPGEGS